MFVESDEVFFSYHFDRDLGTSSLKVSRYIVFHKLLGLNRRVINFDVSPTSERQATGLRARICGDVLPTLKSCLGVTTSVGRRVPRGVANRTGPPS